MNSGTKKIARYVLLTGVAATLTAALVLLPHGHNMLQGCYGSPPRPVDPQEEDKAETLHLAGLQNDRSQIPSLIVAIEEHTPTWSTLPAIHALARMGVTEALPALDWWIQDERRPIIQSEARVAKARIIALNGASSVKGASAQAASVISRFYSELGLTSVDINAAVADYYTRLEQQLRTNTYRGSSSLLKPVEVFAMQDVADMVYHGSYSAYASLPGVTQLNFQRDEASALKMRLAPLSRADRLNTLCKELAEDKTQALSNICKMQLIADEGSAGSQAVATKLRDMDAHQSLHTNENFRTLFRVLAATGDKSQGPLVQHFQDEHSRKLVAANEVAGTVAFANGYKKQFVPGY